MWAWCDYCCVRLLLCKLHHKFQGVGGCCLCACVRIWLCLVYVRAGACVVRVIWLMPICTSTQAPCLLFAANRDETTVDKAKAELGKAETKLETRIEEGADEFTARTGVATAQAGVDTAQGLVITCTTAVQSFMVAGNEPNQGPRLVKSVIHFLD